MGQWLCNDKMVDHDFGGCILKFLLGMSMIFYTYSISYLLAVFQENEKPIVKIRHQPSKSHRNYGDFIWTSLR